MYICLFLILKDILKPCIWGSRLEDVGGTAAQLGDFIKNFFGLSPNDFTCPEKRVCHFFSQ